MLVNDIRNKRYTHERLVSLEDDEIAAKISKRTGEIKEVYDTQRRNHKDLVKFSDIRFTKQYERSWMKLREMVSPLEYRVAHTLSMRVSPITNSLAPFNDDTTRKVLADEFLISVRMVKETLDNLFVAGVYAKFALYEDNYKFTKYWVFNPFLSLNGTWLHNRTLQLFKDTTLAKAFYAV